MMKKIKMSEFESIDLRVFFQKKKINKNKINSMTTLIAIRKI